jgi:hypothetical protein
MRPYIWFFSPFWRPGFRAAVSDKGADAATGSGHVMHTSATTGLLKSALGLVAGCSLGCMVIVIAVEVKVARRIVKSSYNYNLTFFLSYY